jgi:hypothetical protein
MRKSTPFVLLLALATATSTAEAQILEREVLLAPDGAPGDEFGAALSLSGTTLVVGAPLADQSGKDSGTAYVFERTYLAWDAGLELPATGGATDDNFGLSVAVSGGTIVIGAPGHDQKASNAGAAYVFARSGTTWAQQALLLPSTGAANDAFGVSVSVSGNTILVGSPRADRGGSDSGSAYVFVRSGTTWSEQTELIASDGAASDLYGVSVAVSGGLATVGAPQDDDKGLDSGSAYVYLRSGTSWALDIKTVALGGQAGDNYGIAVDCHEPQMSVAVGATKDDQLAVDAGAVHLFSKTRGNWTILGKLFGRGKTSDRFGGSVAIGAGLTVFAGARFDDFLAQDGGLAFRFRGPAGAFRAFGASDAFPGDQLGAAVDFDGCWGADGAPKANPKGADSGAVYLHILSEPAVNYCTAGLSSAGCTASVTVGGIASASAPTGFSIQATGVEGGQNGIFYYGLNGRQSVPWAANSYQCVQPPVKRTGGRMASSGTPGQCDGVLTVDMNSFWSSKPLQNPGPGTVVDAQFWYRGPTVQFAGSATLSDAIEFEVCP